MTTETQTFKSIYERYSYVQCRIGVKKAHENKFGKFKYLTIEDINDRAKPLLAEAGLVLSITNEVIMLGVDTPYIKATATLYDFDGNSVSNSSMAKIAPSAAGMSDPQVTGAAITYVNKYALGALFAIQTNEDPDALENGGKVEKSAPAKKTIQQPKTRLNEIKTQMNELVNQDKTIAPKASYFINNKLGKKSFAELDESEAERLLHFLTSAPAAAAETLQE